MGLWRLKWTEHFTAVNVTVQLVLPFLQDLSNALGDEDAQELEPEPAILDETRKSLLKASRAYLRTTAKQGVCIAVGCALMLRDHGATALTETVPRNLVYYWDNLGYQLPIYFNIELVRSLSLPDSVARIMGTCPDPEHLAYFVALAQSATGAALLSLRQAWIPATADLTVEGALALYRHRRRPRRAWPDLLRLCVDKAALLVLQCLLASLGSRLHPAFGTYWLEVVGALLLRSTISAAAQTLLGLPPPPPPDPKGPRPILEAGRAKKLT